MKNKTFARLIGVLIILVAGYFILGGGFDFDISKDAKDKTKNKATSTKYINENGEEYEVPHGKYNFQVSSGDKEGIVFLEGEIDPPDVHLGDMQSFRIVVRSEVGIDSVVANIETDNGTTTVPLERTGTLDSSELSVPRLKVDENQVVEVLTEDERNQIAEDMQEGYAPTAYAQEGENEVWEGQWKVDNVHDTTYITNFVAADNNGKKETLTLAWSDKCGIPINGNWTSSSDCTHSSGIDGVVGDATLSSGDDFHLSAPSYDDFVITGKLNLNGRVILSGGNLHVGYDENSFWIEDEDGDGYPPSGYNQAMGGLDSGVEDFYSLRKNMNGWNIDCVDTASNVHPEQTQYFSSQGANGWDYNCSGATEYEYTTDASRCATGKTGDPYRGWDWTSPGCGESGTLYLDSSCYAVDAQQGCH